MGYNLAPKKMKKLLLLGLAVIGFAFAANAQQDRASVPGDQGNTVFVSVSDDSQASSSLKFYNNSTKSLEVCVSVFNDQGGMLWITKDEVVFKPHKLNFGNLGKKYIRIQDVSGYSKGFLTNFSIWTKDGSEMGLVVWKKDEIIREVEKRRHAFYQSKGLPTPPLRFGNVSL